MPYPNFGHSPYRYPGAGNQQLPSYSAPPPDAVPAASSPPDPSLQHTGYSYEWRGLSPTGLQGGDTPQIMDSSSWTSNSGFNFQQEAGYRNFPANVSQYPTPTQDQTQFEFKGMTFASGIELTGSDNLGSQLSPPAVADVEDLSGERSQNQKISAVNIAHPHEPGGWQLNLDRQSPEQKRSGNVAAAAMAALSTTTPPRSFSQSSPPQSATPPLSNITADALLLANTISPGDPKASATETGLECSQQVVSQFEASTMSSSNPRVHLEDSSGLLTGENHSNYTPPYMELPSGFSDSNGLRNPSGQAQGPRLPAASSSASPKGFAQDGQPTDKPASVIQASHLDQPSTLEPADVHSVNSSGVSYMLHIPRHGDMDLQPVSSPPTPLPGYIDPSQIYNPYRLDYERLEAAEAAAELKRRQDEEDAEGKRKREVEAKQKQEAELEAQRRQDAEAEGNARREAEAQAKRRNGNITDVRRKPGRGRKPLASRRQNPQSVAEQPGNVGKSVDSFSSSTPNTVAGTRRSRKSSKNQTIPPSRSHGLSEEKDSLKTPNSIPSTQSIGENGPHLPHGNVTPQNGSTSSTQGPPGEEDMASEMKEMIEKMRTWKTKNPSLFTKLWDDLKKGQTTSELGIHPASPRPSHISLPLETVPAESAAAPIASSEESHTTLKTTSLPDLGKFPAARRRRYLKSNAPTAASSAAVVSEATATERRNTNSNESRRATDKDAFPGTSTVASTSPQAQIPPPRQQGHGPDLPLSVNVQETEKSTDFSQDVQAIPTSQTPNQATGTTIWPEPKRIALAQAASRYIESVEENADKTCSPALMLSLINRNPSYVQLCGMVESRGFTINRVHFARYLLNSVPDINDGTSRPAAPALVKAGATAQPLPSLKQTQTLIQSNQPDKLSVSQISPTSETDAVTLQPEPAACVAVPDPAPDHRVGTSTPVSLDTGRLQNSLSQAEAGGPFPQQRDISSETLPSKHHNLASHVAFPTTYHPSLGNPTPGFPASHQLSISPRAKHILSGAGPIGVKKNTTLGVPAPPPTPAPGSKEAMARKRVFSEIVDLTQNLSDEDASERASKEPRHEYSSGNRVNDTDVSQQHTTQLGPDQEPVSSKIMDLSKFKLPNTGTSSRSESLRRHPDIVKPLNKAEALRKSYYDPKTIARDILVAAGRHPKERPLNSHLGKLRETFSAVDNSSDLRTFLWDLVDPGGPPRPEVAPVPLVTRPPRIKLSQFASDQDGGESPDMPRDSSNWRPHKPSGLRISSTVDGSDKASDRGSETGSGKANPPAQETSLMSSTPPIPGPRRRGRPPGAKNKPRLSTPSSSKTPKHIEIAVPVRTKSLSPPSSYSVYGCEWQGCGAQLHNLETLRTHVMKIHVNSPNHNPTCMWGSCGVEDSGVEGQIIRKAFTSEGLYEHVENIHVAPVAWRMGDGPVPAGSGQRQIDITSCLNDCSGRLVTPRATTTGPRPSLIFPAGYRSIRSLNKMNGNETDRSKALEVMRALETKQLRIGTGLSRGGCTLMNPKRLSTVEAFEYVFDIAPTEDERY